PEPAAGPAPDSRMQRPTPPDEPGPGAPSAPPPLGPRRTYGRPPRRLRVGVALVTAALAFVVAMFAITVPEVIGGKSLTGDHATTFFGGKTSKSASQEESGQAEEEESDRSEEETKEQQERPEGRSSTSDARSKASQQSRQGSGEDRAPAGGAKSAPPSSGPSGSGTQSPGGTSP
ncbi:MAG: hypothetical protein M3133_06680, partial [Actinomycetota bacterium]|nr:hypothetical protein [Actinomycetota bacterium]